jgi:hypothetical protein
MRCDSFFELLEDRQLFAATASIRGFVFNDINANTHRDSGETGIPTVTVYLDTNNNKKLDASEKRTTTDANGNVKFTRREWRRPSRHTGTAYM